MDILQYRENRKVTILLVEDEEILAKIYYNTLAREGYRILLSKSGKSAINKYNEHPVHVVILDLMLPDISGLDILKHIRTKSDKTRVIVLTNMLNAEIMRECTELGVNLYLSKSDYTPDQIVARIKETLNNSKNLTMSQ